ncbi:MAG TPA: preprotein translocase subunit SecE [Candidatus Polarisedimenticolia bacterium]|nr:preprotein translocase subunit SecE [Candidatus Polarisedimenticolia bacterium]
MAAHGGAERGMNWVQRLRAFMTEVRSEVKRTSFPSRPEVQGTTTVVIITVFIFALFLWVVDSALFKIVDWVFRVAG